jgi:hypothetical protein
MITETSISFESDGCGETGAAAKDSETARFISVSKRRRLH